MKLQNYNTSKLYTKFSTQNSFCLSFIKLWENSFCRVFMFVCDSTLPTGTATTSTTVAMPSSCRYANRRYITPAIISIPSDLQTAFSQQSNIDCCEHIPYIRTANVHMKGRIALRNSSRLLLLLYLLQLLLLHHKHRILVSIHPWTASQQNFVNAVPLNYELTVESRIQYLPPPS